MATFTREYERVTCPGCQRKISAYIPHFGDGSGLRVVPHNDARMMRRTFPCPVSGRMITRDPHSHAWKVDF